MALAVIITVLCGVGLYASIFMLRKAARGQQGLLEEPSVVQTSRARLFGGVPNAAFGIIYYVAAGTGVWLPAQPAYDWPLALAAVAAALASSYLAYSLLFVTRMPCVYCWTSHVVNWALAALTILRAIHPST